MHGLGWAQSSAQSSEWGVGCRSAKDVAVFGFTSEAAPMVCWWWRPGLPPFCECTRQQQVSLPTAVVCRGAVYKGHSCDLSLLHYASVWAWGCVHHHSHARALCFISAVMSPAVHSTCMLLVFAALVLP